MLVLRANIMTIILIINYKTILKPMKRLLILFMSIMVIGTISISSSSFTTSNEWTLYKQAQGVQIYFKTVDCDDVTNGLYQRYVLLKVVNTTNFDVNVKWKNDLWYDNNCTTCEDQSVENKVNLLVKAKSELVGNCTDLQLKIFSEFKNHADVPKLTKFELSNLEIKVAL